MSRRWWGRADGVGIGSDFAADAPVSAAVVSSRIEAELVVGLLRSHGLRAAAVTDEAGGQEPQWRLNGVQVLVPVADVHAARELLATVDDPIG